MEKIRVKETALRYISQRLIQSLEFQVNKTNEHEVEN